MKMRPAAVLVLGGVLAGWALSHVTCSKTEGPREIGEMVFEGEVEIPEGELPTTVTPAPPGVQDIPMQEIPPEAAAAKPLRPELPFEYSKEIDLFRDMQKRLFLTEADQAEKQRLLNDVALLRALGLRLTEPSNSPAVMESQDVAVDLLMEAVKSGDREAASEVLMSVVQDGQVESAGLDQGVRQHMAGLKGEIMLRWAALAPQEAAQIERNLPGPVSRKIWDNVKRRQESNQLER